MQRDYIPRNRSLDGEMSMSRGLSEYHYQESQSRAGITQMWRVRSVELRQKRPHCFNSKGIKKRNLSFNKGKSEKQGGTWGRNRKTTVKV